MSPRRFGGSASVGDSKGQYSIAPQRIGLCRFTSVHIWLARISGGIDQESRLHFTEQMQQDLIIRVVNFVPCNTEKGTLACFEFVRKGLADVTAGAEKENHEANKIILHRDPLPRC